MSWAFPMAGFQPTLYGRFWVTPEEKNARRKRGQITLVFDPTQRVPDHVLNAIIDEWLVPSLVKEFSAELRARRKAPDLAARTSTIN